MKYNKIKNNYELIEFLSLSKRDTLYNNLTSRNGIGIHVKNAVMNRNIFLPQTSDNEPMRGADKKLNNPFTPIITPFNINAWSCNQRLMRILITVDISL